MGGNPPHGPVLEGFQDQVALLLAVRLPRQRTDRKWEYILAAASAREKAGLVVIEEYIRRRQNTITQFIDMLLLM